MVGAVRAAGGEYPHFLFAAQAGRAHQRRPAFSEYAMENKVYPDIVEVLQAAHAVGGKFGMEGDADFGCGHQARLAGDTEFLFVGGGGFAYGFDGVGHCG